DRQQDRRVEARADEHQAVTVDRPRDHRVALVAHLPDLFPRGRVVGDDGVRAGTYHLLLPLDVDQERRAEAELLDGVAGLAVGPPDLPAGGGVEGDDELLVAAVAAEDQLVVGQDRRAAVAVDRLGIPLVVLPHHLAAQVQARRPHVAEVDVEPLTADQRRRAGVAVFLMDARRFLGVFPEQLLLPEQPAVLDAQGEGGQRQVRDVGDGNGGGQEHLTIDNDRRRPAGAGHFLLPNNVFGLAPFERQGAILDQALPRGAPELRPTRRSRRRRRRDEEGRKAEP